MIASMQRFQIVQQYRVVARFAFELFIVASSRVMTAEWPEKTSGAALADALLTAVK
jgi:hypothetical protein